MSNRAKENERRKEKERPSLLIFELLDIATARHRTYAYLLLPYCQLEGFLRMMSIHIKKLKEVVPDFTTIWRWRVERTKINLGPKIDPENDDIVIAVVDSTGIKVTNRGEWIDT